METVVVYSIAATRVREGLNLGRFEQSLRNCFTFLLCLIVGLLATLPFEPYVYQRADFDPTYGQDELRYLNGLSRSRVEDYWRNVRNKAFFETGGLKMVDDPSAFERSTAIWLHETSAEERRLFEENSLTGREMESGRAAVVEPEIILVPQVDRD